MSLLQELTLLECVGGVTRLELVGGVTLLERVGGVTSLERVVFMSPVDGDNVPVYVCS